MLENDQKFEIEAIFSSNITKLTDNAFNGDILIEYIDNKLSQFFNQQISFYHDDDDDIDVIVCTDPLSFVIEDENE